MAKTPMTKQEEMYFMRKYVPFSRGALSDSGFLEFVICLKPGYPDQGHLFFTLDKKLLLVARCVSEGCQAVSLAYAAGCDW